MTWNYYQLIPHLLTSFLSSWNTNEKLKPARNVCTRSSVTTSAAITSVKSEMKMDVSNQSDTSEKIDVSQTNEVIVGAIVKNKSPS
jgi:hypothetical protein